MATNTIPTAIRRPYRAALVDVSIAMFQLGCDLPTLYEMADGDLRWVWNVATNAQGTMRELRFWIGELKDRSVRNLDAGQVIASIVGHPHEVNLSRRTVGQMLRLSPQGVLNLVRGGQLTPAPGGNRSLVTRASVVEFLRLRLVERMNGNG